MSNITNEQIQEIRQSLIKLIKAHHDVSSRSIGNSIGRSSSLVNQFINDKYPTPNTLSEFAGLIENYLNNYSVSQDAIGKGTLKFAMTNSAQSIFKIANFAMSEGKIGVISGVPGCGKTITVKEYTKRNPVTILIEVTPIVTLRSLIEDICKEIKIPTVITDDTGKSPRQVSKNDLFNSIVNRLAGSKRLLIIDEGENLTVPCLEIIRRIQDFAEIGILLSGTSRLLDRLRGTRKELQQLFSRVGIQKEIKLLELGDIKAILTANYPEAQKFASTFLSLSKHNGRYLQHLITLVKKTIQETGEPLSDDLIDDAASSLLT